MLFSSRVIPGNEKAINHIKNMLSEAGIHIITDKMAKIHVSGHPYRDEIKDMYDWLKPHIVIPVHGEREQLEAHAGLADSHGIDHIFVPNNGDLIRLSKDGVSHVDHVPVGMLAVERKRVIDAESPTIKERRKATFDGTAFVTVILDKKGKLKAEPMLSTIGLLDEDRDEDLDMLDEVEDGITDLIEKMDKDKLADDNHVHETIRIATRRFFKNRLAMRPITHVHLFRV